jgi:PQQ-dependent catabolism-associated CXXCW motif protein
MMRKFACVVVVGAAVLVATSAPCENRRAEPEHYRNEDYRAPTPATLRGARVITTAQAEALWRAGTAAFVDVMPDVPRPPDLPAGTLWQGKPRHNIPGSIWLADTGYATLRQRDAPESRFEADHRRRARQARGDLLPARLRMSWDAAKRRCHEDMPPSPGTPTRRWLVGRPASAQQVHPPRRFR